MTRATLNASGRSFVLDIDPDSGHTEFIDPPYYPGGPLADVLAARLPTLTWPGDDAAMILDTIRAGER